MMELIKNWKIIWWRRFSTWLAALNGLFVTYVFSQPILVVGLLGFSPREWLVPLAAAAGFAAFALPVLVAHVKQPKLDEKVKSHDAETTSR